MIEPPEIHYATTADGVHIGYQVFGDGPIQMVNIPEWSVNLEVVWEVPVIERIQHRLAAFARVTTFNRRGTGVSDPVPAADLGSLETWMDDVTAVMDAVGLDRVALMGTGFSGAMAMIFAATYPQRVSALVLFGAYARLSWAPDYERGLSDERLQRMIAGVERHWGTGRGAVARLALPDPSADTLRQYARLERLSASPSTATAMMTASFACDVRDVLDAISVPTLVVQGGKMLIGQEHGRYLAERIRGAKFVELAEEWWTLETIDAFVDEVEEFLTGARPDAEIDRVLTTVIFADLVGSTERSAQIGDHRWRSLLDQYDPAARRQIERFRGREVFTKGDEFLVTFDGPARAVRCALAMRESAHRFGLELRIGVHTGEVELRGDDITGLAVNIGARIRELAKPGEVLASRTVTDLVAGSGISFDDRGEHELKGVPGTWKLFAVEG